jgi:hypothetical protein
MGYQHVEDWSRELFLLQGQIPLVTTSARNSTSLSSSAKLLPVGRRAADIKRYLP